MYIWSPFWAIDKLPLKAQWYTLVDLYSYLYSYIVLVCFDLFIDMDEKCLHGDIEPGKHNNVIF